MKGAAIRNVVFDGVSVSSADGADVAVLAQSIDVDGFVTGCVFRNCQVTVGTASANAAVVVAQNRGSITNCIVEESTKFVSEEPISQCVIGGIAAVNGTDCGYIINCISRVGFQLAEGSVGTIGGIAGTNKSVIGYCFAEVEAQGESFGHIAAVDTGSEREIKRCLYLSEGVYTMVAGVTGKDYSGMDVYQLAAEMSELVMNEYDQDLDLSWFSEKELGCGWSVEDGALSLSLDGKTAQVYLYVDDDLSDATVTFSDPDAREVDPGVFAGRKYSVRVGRKDGESYERYTFKVSYELDHHTMVENFVLRPNASFVKKLTNTMDGVDTNYSDLFLAPSRVDGGVVQVYEAEQGMYPFAMMLSLTNLKPNDELVSYRFVGAGTADDPYQISTVWELSLLAEYVSADKSFGGLSFSRAHYILTNDLDLTGWTQTPLAPIGTITAPFRGVFDGRGHWIRGFTVSNTASYQGLFGVVQGDGTNRAKIMDLVVYDVQITGPESGSHGDLRGGVVGRASYADLIGVVAQGIVSGGTQIGGIVGYSYHCDILNCGSVAALTTYSSRAWTGGIVGNAAYGRVENCYADVTYVHENVVQEQYLQVGAIAGELKDAKILHCFYDGAEGLSLYDKGFVVESNATAMVSWTFAEMLSKYAEEMDVEVSWLPRQGNVEFAYPVPIPADQAAHSIVGVPSSLGALVSDRSSAAAGERVTISAGETVDGAVLTGLVILDKTYQRLYLPVTDNLDGTFSFTMPSRAVYVAPVFDSDAIYGSGTAESPYLLMDYEDLGLMARLVAGSTAPITGCEPYATACYRLVADIDCGGQELPQIGTEAVPFSGQLDGNGHAISNYVQSQGGLFQYLAKGAQDVSITDLTLKDATIQGGAVLATHTDGAVVFVDICIQDIKIQGAAAGLVYGPANVTLINSILRGVTFDSADAALVMYQGAEDGSSSFTMDNVILDGLTGTVRSVGVGIVDATPINVFYKDSEICMGSAIDDMADGSFIAGMSYRAEKELSGYDASLWGGDDSHGIALMDGSEDAVSAIVYADVFSTSTYQLLDMDTAPGYAKAGTQVLISYDSAMSIADLVITGPQGVVDYVVQMDADGTAKLCFLMPQGSVSITNSDKAICYKGLTGVGTEIDPYRIETAKDLMFFADVCNGTIAQDSVNYNIPYIDAYVRLISDIPMKGKAWKGIGNCDGESILFNGNFDGDGHTISELNVDAGLADGERQGLFIHLGSTAVVEDLIVDKADIYTNALPEVGTGVIAKRSAGTIRRCMVTNALIQNESDTYMGGIVGCNDGIVASCGIVGSTLQRPSSNGVKAGAVAFANFGTVRDCFSYDCTMVNTGSTQGAIISTGNAPVDCYYYTTADVMEQLEGATQMTQTEFSDGTVAWLLNDGVSDGSQIWHQIIDSGETADPWPVPFYKADGVVYVSSCNIQKYTNGATSADQHFAKDSICPDCGAFQPAEQFEGDGDGYNFRVYNVGQLFWIAQQQNQVFNAIRANVYLMDDIDLNPGYTFHADGTVTYEGKTVTEGWRTWTPIGLYSITNGVDHQYHGTFYGNGHTVSGAYVDDPENYYIGLVGYTYQGTVRDVAVVNSYFRGAAGVGGVVGSCDGNMYNCFSSATVVATNNWGEAGGIAGTVSYIYSNFKGNCAVGQVTGGHSLVGHLRSEATSAYNYYLSDTETEDGGKTAAQFASGEVAYLLNGSTDQGELAWGQTIGTDPWPVLGGETVYKLAYCDGSAYDYSNEPGDVLHLGYDEDGFCTGCGGCQSAVLEEDVYEIWNLGQLIWFGQKIVEDRTVKGSLMADLTIVSDSWVPLGQGVEFIGSFDGNGHTITMELDFGDAPYEAPVGLFSNSASAATFSDLVLKGSLTCNSDERVGALIGSAYNTTIENVLSYVDVTNTAVAESNGNSHPGTGGITGLFGGGGHAVMRNCAVYANVTAGYECVGGLVGKGWPGKQYYKIENCAFMGHVTATAEIPAGAVVGYHSTDYNVTRFTNIYYLEFDGMAAFGKMDGVENTNYVITDVEEKSLGAFRIGQVAYLLGSGFGQTIGTDLEPVPGGPQVYYGYTSCAEDADAEYTNDSTASPNRPEHELVMCYDETVHWSVCDCGYITVSKAHFGGTAYCNSRKVCDGCDQPYGDLDPENHASDVYVDGLRTCCGEAQVTEPAVTLQYPSLSFDSEIRYNIYYTVSGVEDAQEMGLVIFAEKLDDGTIDDGIETVSAYSTDGSIYMVQSDPIAAKRMGDTMYFKVYVKRGDGSYIYSDIASYSAVVYAQDILEKSESDHMRSLVVALLNYGTAAQKHFGHRTDALMNASLTDQQLSLVGAYDSGMATEPNGVDSGKVGDFLETAAGFDIRYPSVSFEGAFAVNYYFAPSFQVEGEMTFYYWTQEDYEAADILTMENCTGAKTMVKATGAELYWADVSGIAAKEIDETIFVCGVYESGGQRYCTGVLSYSLSAYCVDTMDDDDASMQQLARETVVYGWYAKEYFADL
ncbi:MAG: hypothetical protein IJW45_00515 [Oscillospiraceae bacterium]|nr:hypothetical protein [Oscillospiraceae bacterium]